MTGASSTTAGAVFLSYASEVAEADQISSYVTAKIVGETTPKLPSP
jgi:hypothetical protein